MTTTNEKCADSLDSSRQLIRMLRSGQQSSMSERR